MNKIYQIYPGLVYEGGGKVIHLELTAKAKAGERSDTQDNPRDLGICDTF